jgi:hypothetical protein
MLLFVDFIDFYRQTRCFEYGHSFNCFTTMTLQITIVIILTFIINLIATLSYSVRIVGVRTGRIAVSLALFNVLVLISRTANGFQAPLLAKSVENDIKFGAFDREVQFRLIILSCTIATIVGALLVPTFQRILSRAVVNFSVHRSIPKILFHGFSKAGFSHFGKELKPPDKKNLT